MPQQSLCILAPGSNDHAGCPYAWSHDLRGRVLKMNMKQREGWNGQEPTCTTEVNSFTDFATPSKIGQVVSQRRGTQHSFPFHTPLHFDRYC